MQPRPDTCLAMTVLCLLAAGAVPAHAEGPETTVLAEHAPDFEPARKAVERGLAFLQADATKWREERKCDSCHHGTMTVWALSEAKSRGYATRRICENCRQSIGP